MLLKTTYWFYFSVYHETWNYYNGFVPEKVSSAIHKRKDLDNQQRGTDKGE